VPSVSQGRIERLANVRSKFVDARNVDVWLPPGYDGRTRMPVVYMHDGQMLFDSTVTWNKQEWQVDEIVARLIGVGTIGPVIVVGVWNNGKRRASEYWPARALATLPDTTRRRVVQSALDSVPRADAYLRFLVTELKPAIDRRFATKTDRANTFTMGSSMGGLISLYALCEYPQIFGGAAALSTHWVGGYAPNATVPLSFFTYLQRHLPDPSTHRLWMDAGTVELDSLYTMHLPIAERLARDRGYDDRSLVSRVYPGQGHNERAWAARLDQPFTFLLAPAASGIKEDRDREPTVGATAPRSSPGTHRPLEGPHRSHRTARANRRPR
jgi:enterochelin esterase-like enzyme